MGALMELALPRVVLASPVRVLRMMSLHDTAPLLPHNHRAHTHHLQGPYKAPG